ncbi:dynein axonemal intermediate chain 4-like [Anoplopoma fimbria]|uniref:dynein axonemal intermediate chain 4-like n=1 Tax=Anoplopoma fimbria TaxID=229290 RepID=UPI0023EB25AE|nr:dynein axonemal intermediate chain 4-like [Anoplopoma fimbria]
MKKSSLMLSSHRSSFSRTGRSSVSAGGRTGIHPERSTDQVPREAVRVLDDDGDDVTPWPLSRAEPGHVTSKPGRSFLDEIFTSSGSEHLKSGSSFIGPSFSSSMGSSRPSTATSLTKGTEDSLIKLDIPINPPVPCKRDNVKQHVTEEMLNEVVGICLSETDTISLLDMPPTFMSEDADDSEAIKESNVQYAELCKNRLGNEKYVERSMQTLNGSPKNKQTQTDKIVAVDEETSASVSDIYDSLQNNTPESGDKAVYAETSMNTSKGQENSGQQSSNCSAVGSTISSQVETEIHGNNLNTDYDAELIMSSEAFKYSLLVMERSIVANNFQTELAAYRQLPSLEDPGSTVKPRTKEQSEESEESSSSPTLEPLLAFSCKLTRGRNITSMAWNKRNPDILAVSYSDYDSRNQKPSLICCWCFKNPTWPERVFYCSSCVISLDFSANNPGQLAVGAQDGTVAIYDVSQCNVTCIANNSNCFKRHLHPVWQVNWTKQGIKISGKDRVEALISVSADGRICKWFLCSDGLDCIDLMMLKQPPNRKKKAAAKKKTEQVLPVAGTPGLWVDFHPTESSIYVVGTWGGTIYKCSISNSQNVLETYEKHFRPVNRIEWSPFSSDVFLSCSSDWTIQLWRKDLFTPVLSFTSTRRAVHAVKWSPNWSTVFAAHNGQQVEIWDLNSSILQPIIVHHAAAGVKVTSLLFTTGTDCVLVGDSNGQVTVYQIKNLILGEDKQVESLEDIVNHAASR